MLGTILLRLDDEADAGAALEALEDTELLTEVHRLPDKEKSFTVGLFSVIDALLDAPMEDLLTQLPLDEDINSALTDHEAEGNLAANLRAVLAFEHGEWDLAGTQFAIGEISAAYQRAVTWASEKMATFDQPIAA